MSRIHDVASVGDAGSIRKKARTIGMDGVVVPEEKVLSTSPPFLLYGTAWKKEETSHLVQQAVEAGFRYIDTACQPKHYNEAGVGEGWTTAAERLNLSRSDFYLQTKFTSLNGQDPNRIPYEKSAPIEDQVKTSLTVSLSNLQTEYLDALVLHSPMHTDALTLRVWRTFESFVEEGKVKTLGISNCYNIDTLQLLYNEAKVKPVVVQNRFYAQSQFDPEIRSFCKAHNITYQSFWTLSANRKALASSTAKQLARQKHLSPQTLMYAYMMTMGHTPLSGTTDRGHMAEDMDVVKRIQNGEEILSLEEMELMTELLKKQ